MRFPIVLMLIALQGCTLVRSYAYQDLSAEQISAVQQAGGQVYSCLVAGGPPPLVKTVWIIVPQGHTLNLTFGSNCEVLPGRVE